MLYCWQATKQRCIVNCNQQLTHLMSRWSEYVLGHVSWSTGALLSMLQQRHKYTRRVSFSCTFSSTAFWIGIGYRYLTSIDRTTLDKFTITPCFCILPGVHAMEPRCVVQLFNTAIANGKCTSVLVTTYPWDILNSWNNLHDHVLQCCFLPSVCRCSSPNHTRCSRMLAF